MNEATLVVGGRAVESPTLRPEHSMMARTLVTAALSATLGLCVGCGPREPQQSCHWAVVFDASDSGLGLVATPQTLQRLFRDWVRQALHGPGSSFVVLVPGQSRDTARGVCHIAVPATWGPGVSRAQSAFVGRGLEEVGALRMSGGSAIAEAIQVAVLGLRERVGTRRLVVVSDLRQVTPGRWNFERTVPPPAAFLGWLEHEGLLPDLQGVDLEVVGVHSRRGPEAPEFTGAQEMALRALWEAVFGRMGVTQVALRTDL
ncbi:MAG: hypothetical protein AB1505_33320 [Candidatus Latescibacterota bacterium]